MDESRRNVATGEGGQLGVIPILQGGETGVPSIWVGVLGNILCGDVGIVGHL